MTDSPEEDRALAALTALYSSERADGSAIFAVSLQILAAMLIVAGIAATLLPTEFAKAHATPTLFVPVLAWGLSAYVVIINALMAARVQSIAELEKHLVKVAAQRYSMPSSVASDAGDLTTNIARQPWILKIATLTAYITAFGAVVGVSTFVLRQTAETVPVWETTIFGLCYMLLAFLVLGGFYYIYGGPLATRLRGPKKRVKGP